MDGQQPSMLGGAELVELAKLVYGDVASPAAKELGQGISEIARFARWLVAPFEIANAFRGRFSAWLHRIEQSVPEEERQVAFPSIAGPVLDAMVFLEDNNPLLELYLALLTRAVDKRTASTVHPAFAEIIGRLSPEEALLLFLVRGKHRVAVKNQLVNREHGVTDSISFRAATYTVDAELEQRLHYSERIAEYIEHLESLGLLTSEGTSVSEYVYGGSSSQGSVLVSKDVLVTPFGARFINVCVPKNFGESFPS